MDGLDKSLPVAEGMVAAEEAGNIPSGNGERLCLNCGTVLVDVFCPHCGQKDVPKRQPLGELLSNFISSFWSFESKFFRTGYLLLRPGFLAVEYTQGRRERYYHPARMYVFISFIYFLLLTSLPEANEKDAASSVNEGISISDDLSSFPFDSLHFENFQAYDSAQRGLAPEARDGWLVRQLREREILLTKKYEGNFAGFIDDFTGSYMDNFPKIFFFLLPVFATLFKLLYLRRDFFYSEHLVFSIYYYNFFFLTGSLVMLVDLVPWMDWVVTLLGGWIVLYLLFAMKKMYRQSWRKTIVKYCTFLVAFSVCVGVGLLANLLITLLYI